jgi:hypothetical protein
MAKRSLFRRWRRRRARLSSRLQECEVYGHHWYQHPCHPDCRSCTHCGANQPSERQQEANEHLALRLLDEQDAAWEDARPDIDT